MTKKRATQAAQVTKEKTTSSPPKKGAIAAEHQKALGGFETVSDKIRYLNSQGYTRVEIKNHLGILYQHVRNVLVAPLPKNQQK